MTKEASVVENRNLYIGGSDIPIILGISPFKTRFQLLQEKAGVVENTFTGNEYTAYGDEMESKIRHYINFDRDLPYFPTCQINGDIRCNVDGYNGKDTILEIKTTSQIHEYVDDYNVYLVQLLFYMHNFNKKLGHLAVYERPSDFNTDFDPFRLQEFHININDYKAWVDAILVAVDKFRVDLEQVKANPFITEEELQPKELVEISNKIVVLEEQLAHYETIKDKQAELKARLFELMVDKNIKKWTTNNGTQITRVDEVLPTITTELVFNEKQFKVDHEELYKEYVYTQEKIKKGRSGFVKITLPKA